MVPEMVFHERGYEVITMVVAFVPTECEIDATLLAGRLQEVRMQLLLEKLVGKTLIDEYALGGQLRQAFDEFRCVMRRPG